MHALTTVASSAHDTPDKVVECAKCERDARASREKRHRLVLMEVDAAPASRAVNHDLHGLGLPPRAAAPRRRRRTE